MPHILPTSGIEAFRTCAAPIQRASFSKLYIVRVLPFVSIPMKCLTFLLIATLATSVWAEAKAFDYSLRLNLAVYWGQNSLGLLLSKGEAEKNLTDYCADDTVNIILLSFLDVFPGNDSIPTLTLHGSQYSYQYQDELTDIALQIQTCQDQGKIVLLSLGGEGANYGFLNDSQAEAFADTLWQMFGDANLTAQKRPFGEVKVDGFDLDIETNLTVGFDTLGKSLRKKFEGASKKYYLSAAPQCPFPEKALGPTLNSTWLDFAFIQFYNNQYNCDANTDQFNWITWAQWAQDTSPNKDIKMFLGLPGSLDLAASGYIGDSKVLKNKIELASSNATFGGIMLWDASTAGNNKKKGKLYIEVVKKALSKDLSPKYYANGSYETASSLGSVFRADKYTLLAALIAFVLLF